MSGPTRLLRAYGATSASMLGRAGLQFCQLLILVRILTPSEFGLAAVTISLVAIAQLIADLGLSFSIIHHRNLSHKQLSGVYWLNLAAAGCLSSAMALCTPFIAWAFGEPRLASMTLAISPIFLISAIGMQFRVLAEKNLLFGPLARIEILSAALGGVVAVGSALLGHGAMSLVFGALASASCLSLLSWSVLSRDWRPSLVMPSRDLLPVLRYGAWMTGNNAINALNAHSDNLVGGALLGPSAIGLYTLPRDLVMRVAGVLNPIITRVGMPLMAGAQDDKTRLCAIYEQTMRTTAWMNMPIYGTLLISAEHLVPILFGDQWREATNLLQILACWGALRALGNPVGSLLFACGHAKRSFYWNIAQVCLVVPLLFLAASRFGIHGIAWFLLAWQVAMLVPAHRLLVKPACGMGLLRYLRCFAPQFFITSLIAAMILVWSAR